MRQHERYPTSITAVFRTAHEAIHGTVIDLSLGGAGMVTSEGVPEGRNGVLDLFQGFDKITLPSRVRYIRERPGQWKLHIQFSAVLTDATHEAIEDLLREARVVHILDRRRPPLAS